MVELYCEICDSRFKADEQLAKIMLEDKFDFETSDKPIMCNKCTMEAMILEEEEICNTCLDEACLGCDDDEEWLYSCVECGDVLHHERVGFTHICHNCESEAEHPKDEIEYENFDQVHDSNFPF